LNVFTNIGVKKMKERIFMVNEDVNDDYEMENENE
jgi:hypothetical protein